MKNINCFIFDMDGVIASTDKQHKEAWAETGLKIGVVIPDEFHESIKGLNRVDSLKAILDEFNIEKTNEEFEELLKYKNDLYVSKLSNITRDDTMENVEDLFKLLKKMNKKIILSSASLNAPTILKKVDFLKYFDGVVNPKYLKKSKPDPEIVNKAIELSNHPKEECILIEDAQMGIDAGNAAKIKTIAYEDNGQHNLKNYYIRVTNHNEIIKLLKEEWNGI